MKWEAIRGFGTKELFETKIRSDQTSLFTGMILGASFREARVDVVERLFQEMMVTWTSMIAERE